ncbi:GIY-YIG nuclease family protein [Nonomuraea sp. 3N208]|uniref:GIY-YIG nuclease family protein n=1 Tax=Nonomuraea sp. 3N208 TaxID=3457421 RepID=UPI003FCE97BA
MSARSSAARLPHQLGVYRFRDRHGQILYLGCATDLRSRVQSYWGDLRDRLHLAQMVAQVARVEAVACDSVHEAAWLERNLLETRMPPWNRTAGEETSIYIVVDTRPHTAGVRTSYMARFDGVVGFGPYLGGTRTRQTASGLHRAFPLSYTRGRLTATERDIATRRGIGPQSRTRLAAAVISALDGTNAETAREVLTAARDRAAAALSFELAARPVGRSGHGPGPHVREPSSRIACESGRTPHWSQATQRAASPPNQCGPYSSTTGRCPRKRHHNMSLGRLWIQKPRWTSTPR